MREQTTFSVTVPAFFHGNADTTAACLQALFEDSPVATVALDARHRVVMCNSAFEKLYRFSPDELMASDLDDLITGPNMRNEASTLSRAVLRGEKVHRVTQRCRRDGIILDVEIHGLPLIVEGTITGVVALYQDMTERNRAQTACQQLSYKLDALRHQQGEESLHDLAAQDLAALRWNLTYLQRRAASADPELKQLVQQANDLAARYAYHARSVDPHESAILSITGARHSLTSGRTEAATESGSRVQGHRLRGGLTARESEVLALLAAGMTSRQIASSFGISVRTVESHRIHINQKLGFGSLAELVRYAVRNGFVA